MTEHSPLEDINTLFLHKGVDIIWYCLYGITGYEFALPRL
jgi:hypothetical protein